MKGLNKRSNLKKIGRKPMVDLLKPQFFHFWEIVMSGLVNIMLHSRTSLKNSLLHFLKCWANSCAASKHYCFNNIIFYKKPIPEY